MSEPSPGAGVPAGAAIDPERDEMSRRMMLLSLVALLLVLIFSILGLFLHTLLLRRRGRHLLPIRRHRRRRREILFVLNSQWEAAIMPSRALDASVLRSLPIFVFSEKTHQSPLDCAICLGEFQEEEKGRLLPGCRHSFHINCIDTWFLSHSTCPICRAVVDLPAVTPPPPEAAPISGQTPASPHGEAAETSSSPSVTTTSESRNITSPPSPMTVDLPCSNTNPRATDAGLTGLSSGSPAVQRQHPPADPLLLHKTLTTAQWLPPIRFSGCRTPAFNLQPPPINLRPPSD